MGLSIDSISFWGTFKILCVMFLLISIKINDREIKQQLHVQAKLSSDFQLEHGNIITYIPMAIE